MRRQPTLPVLLVALVSAPAFGSQDTATGEPTVDEIVARSYANETSVRTFGCEFSITTGIAANEGQLLSGAFERISGNARGRLLILDDWELYEFQIGDRFEIRPEPEPGEANGASSGWLPFPGPQLVLKDENYKLAINEMMGSGTIGKGNSFFPSEVFSPRVAMEAVSHSKWASPFGWFFESPVNLTHEIQKSDKCFVISSRVSEGRELITRFDPDCNYLYTEFSIILGDRKASYFVSKSFRLPNGAYFPEVAHGVYAGDDKFPKNTCRWELTGVLHDIKKQDFNIQSPSKRVGIKLADSVVHSTHLNPGAWINPARLEKIFMGAVEKVDPLDLGPLE